MSIGPTRSDPRDRSIDRSIDRTIRTHALRVSMRCDRDGRPVDLVDRSIDRTRGFVREGISGRRRRSLSFDDDSVRRRPYPTTTTRDCAAWTPRIETHIPRGVSFGRARTHRAPMTTTSTTMAMAMAMRATVRAMMTMGASGRGARAARTKGAMRAVHRRMVARGACDAMR